MALVCDSCGRKVAAGWNAQEGGPCNSLVRARTGNYLVCHGTLVDEAGGKYRCPRCQQALFALGNSRRCPMCGGPVFMRY